MASEPRVMYAERIADLTLNGLVKKGDLLAHDGTGWVQADASDAATNLYAQYLAMQGGSSGNVITGCKYCVLSDADAPYTANQTLYTSATAGAHTATRPTTGADVIQVVGRTLSTTDAEINIKDPYELEVFYPTQTYNYQNSGVEASVVDGTTNEWAGVDVDAAAVAGVFVAHFPSNMVGAPLAADVIIDTQAGTAVDLDVTYVAAALTGNVANTGDAGATQTALTTSATTADNKIMKVDISDGMDADFAKAGYVFGVALDPDAGDFILLGLLMRFLVV